MRMLDRRRWRMLDRRRWRMEVSKNRGMEMTDAELHQRIDGLLTRVSSVRSHFVGLLCFLSIWMLSAPLWKAALIGCLASCSMIFHVHDRAVTALVFALTVVSLA